MKTTTARPLDAPLDRDLLIEASAGTGKTYALTTLAARLVVENQLRIERLLIVTFTVAATGELRSRIWRTLREALEEVRAPNRPGRAASKQARELVERWRAADIPGDRVETRLKRALRDFDRATITTIHGFCQRGLRDFALHARTPFEFAVSGDDMLEVGGAVRDFWRRRMAEEPIPLLEFAQEEQFTPVARGRRQDDAVGWTMAHHAVPKALRGDPDAPASENDRPGNRDGRAGPRPNGSTPTGSADSPAGAGEGPAAPAASMSREAAFRAARAAWLKDTNRNVFEEIKKDGGWLSGKKDQAALRAVEVAMERNDPELLAPHHARFFARGSLTAKRKKANPPPDSELWDRLEDIGTAGEGWLARKRRDLLADARRSLQVNAWDNRGLSFNSLLVEFHRALSGENGPALAARVREQFPVTLIDEFQDTDRLQAHIFRTIYNNKDAGAKAAGSGRLFIVGDPKQSIYRFRGADVFAYIEARKRTSARAPLQLTANYRSTADLLKAVNSLFRRANPFLLAEIPFDPASAPEGHDPGHLLIESDTETSEAPLQFRHFPEGPQGKAWTKPRMTAEAARQTASEIARLLELARNGKAHIVRGGQEKRALEAGDIAVLVRTGDQGRKVAESLRKFGAKSVELGVDSVFESAEARSLRRLLDALCADESEFDAAARLRGGLADDLFGLKMTELLKLRDDDAFWETWSARARDWAEVWREKGVATFVRQVLFTREGDEPAFASHLLKYPNGQRRLTNFLHLTDLLHEAETRERLSRRRLLDWFVRSMTDVARGETAQLRLESDENLVKVVTVHRAKGLEFPVVFLPFAWHGQRAKNTKTASFYDPATGAPILDLQPDDKALNRQKAEDYADELRLLYVALTRAAYRCVITWARASDAERSAFAWLLGGVEADDSADVPEDDPWKAVEDNAKRIRGLGGVDARAALSQLVAGAGSAVHIETVSAAPAFPESTARDGGAGAANEGPRTTGRAREPKRTLGAIRQRTSYSALATEAGAAHSQVEHEQVEGPDHDPDEPPAEDPDEAESAPAPAATEPDVFSLPRGSRTGRWLHDIFERSLYPGADLDLVCADVFRRHHVPAKWLAVTKRLVANTLAAPLAPRAAAAFRIRDLDRPITEMEFHLPVCGMQRDELRRTLLDHEYPTALHDTDAKIQGFLHGYVDLVARADDRWYVIDYKSNWLGPHESAYRREQLEEAMRHHGYHLQYLLYLTALDRHLRIRLPDYDYDRHMGGVFYLFVRGIRPGLPGNGVFADRPARETVEAIGACLGEWAP